MYLVTITITITIINSITITINITMTISREDKMYLVRLPADPRPTQDKDGVATNGWLVWRIRICLLPDFNCDIVLLYCYPAVSFFFVGSQGQQSPLRQCGEHLFGYLHLVNT